MLQQRCSALCPLAHLAWGEHQSWELDSFPSRLWESLKGLIVTVSNPPVSPNICYQKNLVLISS